MSSNVHFTSVMEDFRRAKRQAVIQNISILFSGKTDRREHSLLTKARKAFTNWLYGHPAGKWRHEQLSRLEGRLFTNILVVLTGSPNDIRALTLAAYIAKQEGSQLSGLYLTQPNRKNETDFRIIHYQKEFDHLCESAKVSGKLGVVFTKKMNAHILRRANYEDLVILSLGSRRFNSRQLNRLIHRCPIPIITTGTDVYLPINKSLLAFDGSPKSYQALFMSAYLAKFWEIALVVLFVEINQTDPKVSTYEAYRYLDRYCVNAEFIKANGPADIATTTFATEENCDIIIMGGYSSNSVKKLITGSIVDEVVTKGNKPVLICK